MAKEKEYDTPEWEGLDSSCLTAMKADPEGGTLELEFHDGTTIEYDDPSGRFAHGLQNSASPGSYYNRYIKS